MMHKAVIANLKLSSRFYLPPVSISVNWVNCDLNKGGLSAWAAVNVLGEDDLLEVVMQEQDKAIPRESEGT